MVVVVVDGAGKIHHVARVPVTNRGQHENLVGYLPAGAARNLGRADDIHIERQMWAMLFDRTTRHDADFAQIDGVVDLRPGEFFVTELGGGARDDRSFPRFHVPPVNGDTSSWQCRTG